MHSSLVSFDDRYKYCSECGASCVEKIEWNDIWGKQFYYLGKRQHVHKLTCANSKHRMSISGGVTCTEDICKPVDEPKLYKKYTNKNMMVGIKWFLILLGVTILLNAGAIIELFK